MSSSTWSTAFATGWLSLGLALTGCEGEPPFEPDSRDPAVSRGDSGNRVKIEWPGRESRSLQDAIDAAPDGALIEIQEGDHSVAASLRVQDRKLELAGAGAGRDGTGPVTRLVGREPYAVVDEEGRVILRAEAAEPLITSVAGDLVVRDMVLRGFDAAIVAKDDETGRSGKTFAHDLVIENVGRGIVSLGSGDLIVQDTDILKPLWHGIAVKGTAFQTVLDAFEVHETTIINPGCAGIFFSNASTVIASATVIGALCGGIVGFQANGLILDSTLLSNRWAGIILAEAPVFLILDNVIQNTLPTQVLQIAGDGISIFSSPDVTVENNLIFISARAGIGAYGSHVTLEDNTIVCSAFDIDNEIYQGVPTTFDDQGGNQCGCGGPLGTCIAVSSQLVPGIPMNQP
jgi:hypothetical protein